MSDHRSNLPSTPGLPRTPWTVSEQREGHSCKQIGLVYEHFVRTAVQAQEVGGGAVGDLAVHTVRHPERGQVKPEPLEVPDVIELDYPGSE